MITGGAGCLGSGLAGHFSGSASEILLLDDLSTGFIENVPGRENVEFLEASVLDDVTLRRTVAEFRPTVIIHAAASYSDPDNWERDTLVNTMGTINTLRAAQAVGEPRFLYLQSELCYGFQDSGRAFHTSGLMPRSSYSISKTAGELYALQSGINLLSLRLATVLAPNTVVGAVPSFFSKLSTGEPVFCSRAVRDFLGWRDFLNFCELAVQGDGPRGAYNVGPGVGHSIADVFLLMASIMDLDSEPSEIRDVGSDDVPEVVLDTAETNRVFSWSAEQNLRESLSDLITHYRSHPPRALYSHVRENTA